MTSWARTINCLLLASVLVLGSSAAAFAQNTPGYNNKIPESILTPDHVKTPIGDLNHIIFYGK